MRGVPRSSVVAAAVLWMLSSACSSCSSDEDGDDDGFGALGPNAACLVCHIPFVREKLAWDHLAEGIACSDCHGLSAAHANDEEIGATKPDVTFERQDVGPFCRDCHPSHDIRPEEILARAAERGVTGGNAVCTDCHGMHRIEAAGLEGTGVGAIRGRRERFGSPVAAD